MIRTYSLIALCGFALSVATTAVAQEVVHAAGPHAAGQACPAGVSGEGMIVGDGAMAGTTYVGGPLLATAQMQISERMHPHGYWPLYSAGGWHGHYYHTEWGRPVALVVPPTAGRQTAWSWGVGNTTSTPIYHQYGRQYPGAAPYLPYGAGFLPTPQWPSHTDQFGVYSVRGPW